MTLRDQPYLPLYIQDFMTDEKLIECSALATGVYIRLMCIMHKSKDYGSVLLKQKYRQTNKQSNNFALQLDRQMPYSINEIQSGIEELISEEVILLGTDRLTQPRMVKDNDISLKRSAAGKKGGESTQLAKAKPESNSEANSEDENKSINRIELREKIFKSEVFTFKNYPHSMLNEFFLFFSEPNKSKTKMLFETKTTWDLKRRLERWAANTPLKAPQSKRQPQEERTKITMTQKEIIEFKKKHGKYPNQQ